ncbi:MAG: YdeI/OmpD-associated family protein [Solirubrobacteraceae bacterium]
MIEFDAELKQAEGKNATGIDVPAEILERFGAGKRPRVQVTINGHTYQSTVGTMHGVPKIPVSAAVRETAGVIAGERLHVELELGETPRTVAVPDGLAVARAGDSDARAFFDELSYSRRHAHVTWIEQAKRSETRQERVHRTVELLAQRQPQR